MFHFDIQSIETLKKSLRPKQFEILAVSNCINALLSGDDEICISVPTDSICHVQISIWGVDEEVCEIERVSVSETGSYHLRTTKGKMMQLLPYIEDIAKELETHGLVFKLWA